LSPTQISSLGRPLPTPGRARLSAAGRLKDRASAIAR